MGGTPTKEEALPESPLAPVRPRPPPRDLCSSLGVQTPPSQVSGPQPLLVPGPPNPRWVRLDSEAPTLRAAVVAGTAAPGGAAGAAASPVAAAAVASVAVARAGAPAVAPAGVVTAQAAGGRGGAGSVVGDGALPGTGREKKEILAHPEPRALPIHGSHSASVPSTAVVRASCLFPLSLGLRDNFSSKLLCLLPNSCRLFFFFFFPLSAHRAKSPKKVHY